jgi:hypothetical protein
MFWKLYLKNMNLILKESVISLQYITYAYDSIFESIKKEVEDIMPTAQVIPTDFNTNFISLKEGEHKISVAILNGSLLSKLEQMKWNGYVNMNYSFRIQTHEAAAKGLLKVKIIDTSFVKKEKRKKY